MTGWSRFIWNHSIRSGAACPSEGIIEGMKAADLYDADFSEWAVRNAELLRSRHFDDADLEHIAEEIEDLSKREHRALRSAVTQILIHLLKYEMQPAKRSR